MSEQPLRILQVLRAPVGGLFRHVGDLTQGLAARGHAVAVVVDSLSADALTAERLETLRSAAALGIHSLPMPRVLGGGDLTTPVHLRRLAKQLGAEVLHGHGAKGGLHARLAAMGVRERVALYTPHGGVLHFGPRTPSGLIFQNFERLLLPITDAVIFESAFARNSFHELIGRPACPDPVIHNGLRPAEFDAIEPVADAADFVFVGEFRGLKGIHVLLEALEGVRTSTGRPASIAMAGGGPEFEAFRSQVAARRMADRVLLLGVQPARQAFSKGRCVVVPSLKESLPYVVLEAAAAGRPLIATNVGGISEIYGPTAQHLVAAGNAEVLRGAMQAFVDTPGVCASEAAIRLEHVRAHFSVEQMVTEIEALYRQVLNRG